MTDQTNLEFDNTIRILVESEYLSEQSQPSENKFVFAYRINIQNFTIKNCQLISRHWVITESDFSVQEVHGEGVIGQQPIIKPGRAFEYSSAAILKTEVGTMEGFYDMVDEDGNLFQTAIPQFTLSVPRTLQ